MSEYTGFLAKVVEEALSNINNAIDCVEKCEEPLVSLVPWSRYLFDVINLGLAVHRSIVLQGILRKVPEGLRPAFMSSILSVRKDLMPFTRISSECLNAISLALMASVGIAYRLLRLMGTNRYSIGIVRIAAILSRAKTRNGMYLDKETILALLHELRDNVMAASMLLGVMLE